MRAPERGAHDYTFQSDERGSGVPSVAESLIGRSVGAKSRHKTKSTIDKKGGRIYDIIGDTHGHATELRRLLQYLGYRETERGYKHESRKVIFLGDFIDRGQKLREHKQLLGIVMEMVRSGNALSVMGNHEFNALAYHTEIDGKPLRPHSKKNTDQHIAFLQEFDNDPIAKAEVLEFFKTLPLWIELDELRVVHACWDQSSIDALTRLYGGSRMTSELLVKASDPTTKEYKYVETILKGYETPLPSGISFLDKDGNRRYSMRTQWWKDGATCLGDIAIPPDIELGSAHDLSVPTDMPSYGREGKPCFIGHYWLRGKPSPLSDNVGCVDYSVAKQGKLVAYHWDGERKLSSKKFRFLEIRSSTKAKTSSLL